MASIDVTTLASVKAYRGLESGEDSRINTLIPAISSMIENYLNRTLESASRVQYFNVRRRQRRWILKGYPISSVTEIANDSEWNFAASTVLDSDNYTVLGDAGILHIPHYYPLDCGPKALKVTYVGGMAADTTAFQAAFPDIEVAAIQTILYHMQLKNFPAAVSSAIAGTSVSLLRPDQFPDEARAVLDRYKRPAQLV